MFNLASNITIKSLQGIIRFNYVVSVEIVTSIETLTDIATVKFPKKVSWKDKPLSSLIKKGDQITIEIGYAGELKTAFEGYIRKVVDQIPLVLECEDQMFLLKLVKVPAKIYPTLTIKNLLTEFCPIPFEVPDVNLGKFKIAEETSLAKVLDFLRTEYVLSLFVRDGKIYGVLPTTLIGREGNFDAHFLCNEPGSLKQNVISDDIEYILSDDIKIQIIAKNVLKDNTKIEWKEPVDAKGNDYEVKTFFCETAATENDLKKFAQEKMKSVKSDMIRGSVTVFGKPFIKKGDSVRLINSKNSDIDGKEFVAKAVTYQFNSASGRGFNQVVTLGYRLN